MNDLTSYEERIHEIVPELEISTLSLNREGLLNDVVIVNDEIVFRFAKRDFGFKDPREEAAVLRLLRSHVTLQTPEPSMPIPRSWPTAGSPGRLCAGTC
ncbi:MAG TPA: hypothetical protein VHC97_12040 [Thermoanaerobaculia bacterium]|jgi:aminoglycoside 2''-phosphotransferase|nr:hypothetical protein [Thermoanaerobaculia bacterium]